MGELYDHAKGFLKRTTVTRRSKQSNHTHTNKTNENPFKEINRMQTPTPQAQSYIPNRTISQSDQNNLPGLSTTCHFGIGVICPGHQDVQLVTREGAGLTSRQLRAPIVNPRCYHVISTFVSFYISGEPRL